MKIKEIYNKFNKFIFNRFKSESKFSEMLITSSNKILKSKLDENVEQENLQIEKEFSDKKKE
jgi:hypothetical protein